MVIREGIDGTHNSLVMACATASAGGMMQQRQLDHALMKIKVDPDCGALVITRRPFVFALYPPTYTLAGR